MKAPEFRPFQKEQFTQAPWLEPLLRALNAVLGQSVAGLRNGLTLADNLNAEVKSIDVVAADPWLSASFTNSWVDYNAATHHPASYRKRPDGYVQIRGTIKNGTLGASAFTLPDGYRPSKAVGFAANAQAGVAFVVVNAAGEVIPQTGGATTNGFVYLDGVSFEASDPTPAPNPAFPVRLQTRVPSAAGVVVLKAVELSGRDLLPVHAPVAVDWAQDGKTVTINGVTGLVGGSTYRLTLAILGG